MKVLVVGLGLMGGSYAYRLYRKGYTVYGSDVNPDSVAFARFKNYIHEGSCDPEDYISKADIIVLAVYPTAILTFLEKYKSYFREGQLITDVAGVKTSFVPQAYELAKPAHYLSHHPMAGREKAGVWHSDEVVFEAANYLITPLHEDDYGIDILKSLGADLGFKKITVMSIEKHDRMIGFTSQLCHAIAVSLVNSDHDEDTKFYIGDSYRDLTRIAMINENLWSELFLENKDFLLEHIESFEAELDRVKNALYQNDREELKEIFKSSTAIRKGMEK